jgi:hypothetical protein
LDQVTRRTVALGFCTGREYLGVRVLLAFVVVVLAGCGTPQELAKQAEEVHSVAAEGALLAHEAAEGDTRDTFAREHAKALRKLLGKVRPAIEEPRLATVADDVDRTLAELARTPGDRERAAGAERKLERAADAADELAK